jgi:4-oxalocrotonate tautomerase
MLNMPVVEITFFEGRPIEKKRELVASVTEAVSKSIGVDPEGIHVILREVRRDQWAGGGFLRSDRPAPKPQK